jgi:hypothetical protein
MTLVLAGGGLGMLEFRFPPKEHNMPASSRARVQVIRPTMEKSTPVFADEKAKIAWEIGQQVSQLAPELPAETPTMKAKTIGFDPDYQTRGTYAVLLIGTSVGTDKQGVFVVPERTLLALRKMSIPYREI